MSNLGGGLRNVDWNSQRLERFEKNFYVEDKRVTARSDREIEEFRKVKEMKVTHLILTIHRRLCSKDVILHLRLKATMSLVPSLRLMRRVSRITS